MLERAINEIIIELIGHIKKVNDKNNKILVNISRTRQVLKDRETEIVMQNKEICTLKKLRRCYNCNNKSKMNVNACDKCVDFSNWVIGWKYYK